MAAPALMVLVLVLPAGAWPSLGLSRRPCVHCCRPPWHPAAAPGPHTPLSEQAPWVGLSHVRPTIDISILKGEKGEAGTRGHAGRSGKEGPQGSRGLQGHKGQKGQMGFPGAPCQHAHVAFSVGWHEGLHSVEDFQAVPFDMELVNLDSTFDLDGQVPGIYFLSLQVHTWNFKEAYLHILLDQRPMAVLYAQPSERSLMQAQSLLLLLAASSTVWVRMFHRDQDNAIHGEPGDLYITFSGHLVKPASEL
ncbi:LOW QUALITY PROTEIN: complement C1q tumor necrosis factor-related protein 8 [Callospermophilus lateralis]